MRRLPSSVAMSWHLGGIASCGSYMSPPSPCDVSHGNRACALAGRKRIHVCNLGCGLLCGGTARLHQSRHVYWSPFPSPILPTRPVTHLRRCGLETPGCCTGGQARVSLTVSEARGTHRSGRSVVSFSLGWASTELSWCQTVQISSKDWPPSPPPRQSRQASAPLHDNHRLVACARSVGGKRHAAECTSTGWYSI